MHRAQKKWKGPFSRWLSRQPTAGRRQRTELLTTQLQINTILCGGLSARQQRRLLNARHGDVIDRCGSQQGGGGRG